MNTTPGVAATETTFADSIGVEWQNTAEMKAERRMELVAQDLQSAAAARGAVLGHQLASLAAGYREAEQIARAVAHWAQLSSDEWTEGGASLAVARLKGMMAETSINGAFREFHGLMSEKQIANGYSWQQMRDRVKAWAVFEHYAKNDGMTLPDLDVAPDAQPDGTILVSVTELIAVASHVLAGTEWSQIDAEKLESNRALADIIGEGREIIAAELTRQQPEKADDAPPTSTSRATAAKKANAEIAARIERQSDPEAWEQKEQKRKAAKAAQDAARKAVTDGKTVTVQADGTVVPAGEKKPGDADPVDQFDQDGTNRPTETPAQLLAALTDDQLAETLADVVHAIGRRQLAQSVGRDPKTRKPTDVQATIAQALIARDGDEGDENVREGVALMFRIGKAFAKR